MTVRGGGGPRERRKLEYKFLDARPVSGPLVRPRLNSTQLIPSRDDPAKPDWTANVARFRELNDQYPGDASLLEAYGESLLRVGENAQALAVLEKARVLPRDTLVSRFNKVG